MTAQNKHSHLPLPTLRTHSYIKRDILFITLESFTNSILSKVRFPCLRKFKLYICKKNYFFGAAYVKSQKGMILTGELQFYRLQIGISLLTPCCVTTMTAQNKHFHLPPPTLRTHSYIKRDILFITLESFTNSILSKVRFPCLRKFKLYICKKNYFFGAAYVKSQKGMILTGELQFYQLQIGISLLTPCCRRGNATKAEMGATSIQHPPPPPMLRQSITI